MKKFLSAKTDKIVRMLLEAAVLVVILGVAAAMAAEPAVNLGQTSFFDGMPAPNGKGWIFETYNWYFTSDSYKDNNGNGGPFTNPKFNGFVSLEQLIYGWNVPKPGKPGFFVTALLPFISFDTDFDEPGPILKSNRNGLGDLTIGAGLQFAPKELGPGVIFSHRFEFDVVAPTGQYDPDKQINQGSNFWSLNPYWTATLLFGRWETSVRLCYLYNFKNDDPGVPGENDTQAGQAVHANFTFSYGVIPGTLNVGLNGYFFKQLTDNKINGHDIDNSREQVLGLGPGAVWTVDKKNALFFNMYFQSEVRNRFDQNVFQIRWAHFF